MVVIDNDVFEMQARTKRTSGRGLGTVFSAAAAKDQDAAVVEGRINNNGNLLNFASYFKVYVKFWQIFLAKFLLISVKTAITPKGNTE